MKTLIFDCHTFDVGPHGTTTYLQGIINNIEYNNLKIICCANSKENVDKYIKIPYTFQKSYKSFILRNLFSIPITSFRYKSDFVISQYVRPLICRGKIISCIHDVLFVDFPEDFSLFFRYIRIFFYGLSAKFSDYIITTSRYTTNRISEVFKVSKKKIFITTCEANFKKEITKPELKKIRLLTVSRFEKRKRIEVSINALEHLADKGYDVQLTIVGNGVGNYYQHVRRLISASKHKNLINHFEDIDDVTLERHYQESDIFLFPSKSEGFGIPVIEALLTNTVPVVAKNTALSEIEIIGEFFKTEDLSDFYKKIEKIIENYDHYFYALDKQTEKYKEKYSWKNASKVFMDIFKS